MATRVGGTLYYVHSDHLGSTLAVSDADGQAVGRVQYDPWGTVITSTLTAHLTDRLFTGQRFDSSTGLYYYNARYYDPYLGRFIQPDSLVPDPLNPQAWNRFSYDYNNPASYVDPSGHFIPAAVAVPLLFIAGGALAGEVLYAGHLYYTGEQANSADLVTWMVWGAFAGATLYMAPHLVGYGLSLAGVEAFGAATLLSRLGGPATAVPWLTSAGLSAYEVGIFLQLGGWAAVGGLVGLGKPYGGRSPEAFRQLIERHPRGAFKVDDEFIDFLEQLNILPEGSLRGVTSPPDASGIIEVAVGCGYNYADVGHEYVHFNQHLEDRIVSDLEAWMWELKTASEVGDYHWFHQAWGKVHRLLQNPTGLMLR